MLQYCDQKQVMNFVICWVMEGELGREYLNPWTSRQPEQALVAVSLQGDG